MKIIDGRELMGRNEYARHRGDTQNAVAKAEKSGRIAAAVRRDENSGSFVGIDWRLADELWAVNTDPDQAARNGKAGGGGSPASGVSGELGLEATEGARSPREPAMPVDKDPHGLLAARAESAKYAARQAELDYLKSIGSLVSTEEFKTVGARRYRSLRDRLRAIPDRISADVAAERDQSRVHARIAAEIDQVLHELSDDARAEIARGADVGVAA